LKTAKPSVLVIGSSNTDMLVKVDRLPQSGETILGGEFATAAGGKGANQAVSAARAGGEVTFIARVGADTFGQLALDALHANGIHTDYVVRDPARPSGVALIFVAKTGQNSIAVAPGANGKLSPADVRKAKSALCSASVLLLQLETPLPTVQAAVQLAAAAGVRVILNPAPARPLPARLLENLYLLTPNEIEASRLTGVVVNSQETAALAAAKLLARGVQNVIITMGARGAYVAGPGVRRFIAAHKVNAVDATGAGDTFNGALAVAIAEGQSLFEAASFANAAAALSVLRLGAQTSAPTRKEIEHFLAAGKIPSALPAFTPSHNGNNGRSGLTARKIKKGRPNLRRTLASKLAP
jgi:ribokinase